MDKAEPLAALGEGREVTEATWGGKDMWVPKGFMIGSSEDNEFSWPIL